MQGCPGKVKEGFQRKVTMDGKDRWSIPDGNGEHIPDRGEALVKAEKCEPVRSIARTRNSLSLEKKTEGMACRG